MGKKRSEPEVIWGAIINLGGGLIWDKPKKFKRQEGLNGWWKDDDWKIDFIGHRNIEGFFISYSSEDKKDVELFILGAKSLQEVVKHFFVKGEE